MMTDSLYILAQARLPEVVPDFLTSWLGVAFLFLGLVVLILKVWEMLRPKLPWSLPKPLETKEVDRLATRLELNEMGARLEADINEVRRSLDTKEAVARTENGKLHKRVDEVVETLAETKGLLIGVKENTDRLLARSMK